MTNDPGINITRRNFLATLPALGAAFAALTKEADGAQSREHFMQAQAVFRKIRAGASFEKLENGPAVRVLQELLEGWAKSPVVTEQLKSWRFSYEAQQKAPVGVREGPVIPPPPKRELPKGFKVNGVWDKATAAAWKACAAENRTGSESLGPKTLAALEIYNEKHPIVASMPFAKEAQALRAVRLGDNLLRTGHKGPEADAIQSLLQQIDPAWRPRKELDDAALARVAAVTGHTRVDKIGNVIAAKLFAAAEAALSKRPQ